MLRRIVTPRAAALVPPFGGGIPAPTISTSVASSSEIDLTASYTGPPGLATYTFQQLSSLWGGGWFTIAVQSSPSFHVTGLASATSYSFRVEVQTSETPSRTSAWSNIATATTSGTSPGLIKWNPGWYPSNNGIVEGYQNYGINTTDLAAISPYTTGNLLNYSYWFTWGVCEYSLGVYDFTGIGNTLAALAAMTPQRHLILRPLPGTFSQGGPAWNGIIPQYILSNPGTYGSSPDGSTGGWWSYGGVSTNPFCAALHRPAVMARWIAFLQALGAYIDSNPLFEGIFIQENSFMVGDLETAPDYSESALITQCTNMLQACTQTTGTYGAPAFPTSNVMFQNTWFSTPTPTQQFTTTCYNNRVLPGTSDTYGQTTVALGSSSPGPPPTGIYYAWGVAAYRGLTETGEGSTWTGPDLFNLTRFAADIEAPDLGAYGGPGGPGGSGRPIADILNGMNTTYGAAYAFPSILLGTAASYSLPSSNDQGQDCTKNIWGTKGGGQLGDYISANALTNLTYPQNYPT